MYLTLFSILAMNERILVWSSEEDGTIFTWNQSATLQAWNHIGEGRWEEIAIRTCGNPPKGFAAAREAAKRWATEGTGDDR